MQGTDTVRGKVVLIAGGTSGIGKTAASILAATGAEVVVTGRDRERGEAAVREIRRDSGSEKVSLMLVDLAMQAEEFGRRHERLDVLLNNAGPVNSRREETEDGIEATLAVNHLAPFLLTNLLLDLLKSSAPSRVVTVASEARRGAKIVFDDLQSEHHYNGSRVYGMTKLANILFTHELAERLRGSNIVANCLHPAAVNTRFGSDNRGLSVLLFRLFKPFMRSPERGADTAVWLATAPEAGEMTGKYLADRKVISSFEDPHDEAARKRLWAVREELTNLRVPS